MTPRTKKFFRLKENLAAFRTLKNGDYENVLDNFLEKLDACTSDGPITMIVRVPRSAIVGQIREAMSYQELQLKYLLERIRYELTDAESCNDVLLDIATFTKWRLGFDISISVVFGGISLAGFLTKKKLVGFVSLLAALTHIIAFLDELDIRRIELNDQLEDLKSICDSIKSDLAEYNLRQTNHEFIKKSMINRFGKSFMSDNPDPDDLMETYDPDIDPSEYYPE